MNQTEKFLPTSNKAKNVYQIDNFQAYNDSDEPVISEKKRKIIEEKL